MGSTGAQLWGGSPPPPPTPPAPHPASRLPEWAGPPPAPLPPHPLSPALGPPAGTCCPHCTGGWSRGDGTRRGSCGPAVGGSKEGSEGPLPLSVEQGLHPAPGKPAEGPGVGSMAPSSPRVWLWKVSLPLCSWFLSINNSDAAPRPPPAAPQRSASGPQALAQWARGMVLRPRPELGPLSRHPVPGLDHLTYAKNTLASSCSSSGARHGAPQGPGRGPHLLSSPSRRPHPHGNGSPGGRCQPPGQEGFSGWLPVGAAWPQAASDAGARPGRGVCRRLAVGCRGVSGVEVVPSAHAPVLSNLVTDGL